jgi:hypothetical protein
MLFTTTLLLALTCLVSAAPVVERDSQCDSGLKNGKYVDEGCGENLKPTRTADLCLQTDWITAEHSSVIL